MRDTPIACLAARPLARLNRNDLIYRPFGWIFHHPGEISKLKELTGKIIEFAKRVLKIKRIVN